MTDFDVLLCLCVQGLRLRDMVNRHRFHSLVRRLISSFRTEKEPGYEAIGASGYADVTLVWNSVLMATSKS